MEGGPPPTEKQNKTKCYKPWFVTSLKTNKLQTMVCNVLFVLVFVGFSLCFFTLLDLSDFSFWFFLVLVFVCLHFWRSLAVSRSVSLRSLLPLIMARPFGALGRPHPPTNYGQGGVARCGCLGPGVGLWPGGGPRVGWAPATDKGRKQT